MKKIIVATLFCFVSLAFVCPKYLDIPNEIMVLLEKYYTTYPIEKIYVQTDKTYYATGEKIWFKAIMRYEDTLFVDSLSKVLYVELLDAEHKLIVQRTLQVENNTAVGDISLSDSLLAGNYELRAYTSWLCNFGEESFFHKTLTIFQNSITKNVADKSQNITSEKFTTLTDKPVLQFFPEGGDMVKLLRNHVAFKATDGEGRGIFVEGAIQNEEGKICANFKSNELGLGSFRIVPLGTPLTAKIVGVNGDTLSYPLPTILEKGLLLSVTQLTKDSLKLLLQSNLVSFENDEEDYHLIAQSGGKVVFTASTSLEKPVQTLAISTQNIPTGVLQLSLVDENKIPHCERLVFINHHDGLQIGLQANKTVYKPREKIQLDITTNPNNKAAIEAELSVLVVDNNLVTSQEHEENILTRFLLGTELRGNIENPAYYLQNTEQAKQALDYLMMTQGFRRFTWRELLNGKAPNLTYPVEQSLAFSGVVANDNRKSTPVDSANVSLLLNYDWRNTYVNYTTKEGKFMFSGLSFADSVPVLLTALGKKNNQYVKIQLDKPQPIGSTYQLSPLPSFDKKAYMAAVLENSSFMKSFYFDKTTTILKTVEVKGKKEEKIPDYRQGVISLHGSYDGIVKGDENFQSVQGMNVLFALQGRVAGVQVAADTATGAPEIVIRGMSTGGVYTDANPLILYDGMPVSADFFNTISAGDIAAIEVIKSIKRAIYGSRGASGVIAVYSKKGTAKNPPIVYPNKLQTKIKGFYTAQEFFSPNYDTLKMPNPDTRTTIYWKGKVKTDQQGRASLSFFAADLPTNYKIIVEGIAQKGLLLGRKEQEIGIRK